MTVDGRMPTKWPWRLGKHQLAVVQYLYALNVSRKAECDHPFSKDKIDWARGGMSVSATQIGNLCRFDYYSEADNVLEGLTDRGILAPCQHSAMWTFSQDALKKVGFIQDGGDERGIK